MCFTLRKIFATHGLFFFRNTDMTRLIIILIIFIFTTPVSVLADSGTWRIAVGYSFLSQVGELKDTYRHVADSHGDGNNIHNLNIGMICHPYKEFTNGIRIGPGIGPLILLFGDAHHIEVPINMTIGRSFFPNSNYSPYLKAGISYHIAFGDYLAASKPGLYGGIGIEILNKKQLHLGFETAYDGAVVEIENRTNKSNQKIKTGELTIFLYADF